MSENIKNKIIAIDKNISSLLKGQKFYIDYFQREYRWQKKHMTILIDDLTSTFLKSFKTSDKRQDVANYAKYYIGPVVFSENIEEGKKSIIDGQQRITSITLFLIFLNHLQKGSGKEVSISEMIFSEKYGEKSFNMVDESRQVCLKDLFETGKYTVKDNDDETVKNMVERYEDIERVFPEELRGDGLPYFIDWLIENVIIVEIMAYSDENAYTIFETMNDRGLNLTYSEMLKGFVLSKITNPKKRMEIDKIWKNQIKKLHEYDDNEDQSFFQSWFRAKYAQTIRAGRVGSENEDFELIGGRFHNWFKDNHKNLFNLNTSEEIYEFFKYQFPFFVDCYINIYDSKMTYDYNKPHLEYINYWGIADSLQYPLLLASINYNDSKNVVDKKLDFVARFIETFTVRRSINLKKFGQTTIKYTIFNIIKSIRNNDLKELSVNLIAEIDSMDTKWDAISDFCLHSQNKRFVKHLLSRITSYVDNLVGKSTLYGDYHHPKGKQFEIEHIWSNKFEEHRDEFEQEKDFEFYRNSLGDLILLPNGTNQSFGSDKYEDKLEHYIKENTYAQTLHPLCYSKNPNFLKSDKVKQLGFKSYEHFKCEDIESREQLVKRLCEQIYSTDYYKLD